MPYIPFLQSKLFALLKTTEPRRYFDRGDQFGKKFCIWIFLHSLHLAFLAFLLWKAPSLLLWSPSSFTWVPFSVETSEASVMIDCLKRRSASGVTLIVEI